MSDWIPLDPNRISKETTEKPRGEGGVKLTLALSPYDIPEAVRGAYNSTNGRFVIEFSYIAEEPWVPHMHDNTTVLRVGKNSGRLYGIEVDVKAARVPHVELWISVPKLVKRAIADEPHFKSRFRNYEIAKDVIDQRRDSLFGELVGV